MKKIVVTIVFGCFANQLWSQATNLFHIGAIPSSYLGYIDNYPLRIFTNNRRIAQFTSGNSLSSLVGNTGDGLSILNQTPFSSGGNLDMFTSTSLINGQNETHVVWGGNGQISGQGNRFELRANAQGLFFNTELANSVYKFGRLGQITAVVGTNDFWRIGMQADAMPVINGNRRLEVVDGTWQLRLTHTNNKFTDFLTNARVKIILRC